MRSAASLAPVLYGVWLLWSGHYTPFLLAVGAVCSVAVVAIALRMKLVDPESTPLALSLRALPSYVPWLVWKVLRANVDVAVRILAPGPPVSPRLIRIKAGQKTDLARVVYANSITLTPGTVSVDLEGDVITVHALSREAAEELESGEMDRRVTRLEEGR